MEAIYKPRSFHFDIATTTRTRWYRKAVMATRSRQTSAHVQDASISDSTLETESHIQGTSMSSVASTSIRRGRVRSKNIFSTRQTNDTNQKLRIEISEGLSRPVGKYAKQFKTEVGIICRTYAPLACFTWLTIK